MPKIKKQPRADPQQKWEQDTNQMKKGYQVKAAETYECI